jgi:hypothetical protein
LHQVSEGGGNEPSNLLCLCARCHSDHHAGRIPDRSLRTWKHLLLTLNAAYDRASIDTLLALHKVGELGISGDALLTRAGLVASGLIEIGTHVVARTTGIGSSDAVSVRLSTKGRAFVEAWLDGREGDALRSVSIG